MGGWILTGWKLFFRVLIVEFDQVLQGPDFTVVNARKVFFEKRLKGRIYMLLNRGFRSRLVEDVRTAVHMLFLPSSVASSGEISSTGFTTWTTDPSFSYAALYPRNLAEVSPAAIFMY